MSISRRGFLAGSIVTTISATSGHAQQRRLFDGHCHIIDYRFPIVANRDIPRPTFRSTPTWRRAKSLGVVAGAVVSGSFQADDQTYLMDALPRLGIGWVGVTQIPNDYPDDAIAKLGALGIRERALQHVPRPHRQRGRGHGAGHALQFGRGLAFGNLR